MSTKSTIFLTEDNEHCYTDCNEPVTKDGKWIGDEMTMEISKENIRIDANDSQDLIITFTNPESEIYKLISKLKQ